VPSSNTPAVVITGASTGIGAACAAALHDRGFLVFAGVRQEADAHRLSALGQARLVPLRLDVTDAEQIAAAAKTVDQAVGEAGLAGLVNNAGMAVAGPLELLPLAELRRQLEVNVVGQVAMTQAFLPLVRRARGRIVMMGSLNGRVAVPYLGPYCASKHALDALTTALRTELRKWGIEVALVEPGSTASPIWDKTFAEADALIAAADPKAMAMYDADIQAVRKVVGDIAKTAPSPDKVVKAVIHALTARRPKTRYPIGLQTRLMFRAIKWLPDRLWDRILQRAMQLPK
jgi:NAD(P)-dependent dehydrogenase (short-subunit alcohol dehydrogenase family)